jgi:beta-lactamase regulating signal transducer with metallopeptidase domain
MTNLFAFLAALGEYILTWTWEVMLLVLLARGLLLLDRRHRPALRHRVWTMTLAGSLLLPWLPEQVASLSWMKLTKQTWMAGANYSASERSVAPDFDARLLPLPTSRSVQDIAQPGRNEVTSGGAGGTLMPLVGALWLLGIVVAGWRRIRAHSRLGIVAARAVAAPLETLTSLAVASSWTFPGVLPLLLSSDVRGPMLYGWFRPVMLLPADIASWTTIEERIAMIRHEQIHHWRKDHWFSAMESLVRTLMFFHPLAIFACRQFAIERELSCDETVLQSGTGPEGYAETILKVAERGLVTGPSLGGILFASASQLERRIDLLFRQRPPACGTTSLLLSLCVLLMPVMGFGYLQSSPDRTALTGFQDLLPVPIAVLAEPVPGRQAANPARAPEPALTAPQQPAVLSTSRFAVRTDSIKLAETAMLTLVTFQIPYATLTFEDKGGFKVAQGEVGTTLTDLNARIRQTVEDPISVHIASSLFVPNGNGVYQKTFLTAPGQYSLSAFVRDPTTGNIETVTRALEVKRLPNDILTTSSLILANRIVSLPLRTFGSVFQIGNIKVFPSMANEFSKSEPLNAFLQVYGLRIDPTTQKTSAAIETRILTADGREVKRLTEELGSFSGMTSPLPALNGVTITKSLTLGDVDPGEYSIQVTVTDTLTGQAVTSVETFTVR